MKGNLDGVWDGMTSRSNGFPLECSLVMARIGHRGYLPITPHACVGRGRGLAVRCLKPRSRSLRQLVPLKSAVSSIRASRGAPGTVLEALVHSVHYVHRFEGPVSCDAVSVVLPILRTPSRAQWEVWPIADTVGTNEEIGQKTRKKIRSARKQVEARDYHSLRRTSSSEDQVRQVRRNSRDPHAPGVRSKACGQMVRGTVISANGLGKSKTVLLSQRRQAAASHRSRRRFRGAARQWSTRFSPNSWTAYDAVIATPDMMRSVGSSARFSTARV